MYAGVYTNIRDFTDVDPNSLFLSFMHSNILYIEINGHQHVEHSVFPGPSEFLTWVLCSMVAVSVAITERAGPRGVVRQNARSQKHRRNHVTPQWLSLDIQNT